ncbi:hypothetical protein [Virgibacillus sp. SK37]|uniref:hypothetical protein n=1 Tax=Virgibacillus sp. SK37 TaxID=403957 RepID=UPI0004D1E602|nr:hypothetical protein [Virgibacillus sp. SK37]AIF45127.1 hypothetical protein X953_01785 [Virgibacillus sp. SK37]
MNGPFRFIQESFSSGDKQAERRYHLYLPVTELENVDFEVQQLIYEWVRDDLEIKLGIQLDSSTYLHKNILPSTNKVKVNKDASIFDLQPYLNKYRRIEKVVKKKNDAIGKREMIQQVAEENFKGKNITSIVNFDELLKAFQTNGLAKELTYDERSYLYMALNNMEEDGQITEQQKYDLAEVV